ncbi:unnamed protein product [Symbiodinium sp. CCMP2592]|nr:unnamed protein product [Symbiodinium sp. CCMP2592]
MAICMVRSQAVARREPAYESWVMGPIATLGAGFPNSAGLDDSTTPANFFSWAQEIETHLYGYYMASRDAEEEGEEEQREGTNVTEDTVSMMERDRYSDGRRRVAEDADRGEGPVRPPLIPVLGVKGDATNLHLGHGMLREISAQHEAMSVQNRLVSTCALVTILRYMMAELSQTLDVADAIARTREADTDTVEVHLDEEDDEHLLMQAYLLTDGKGTMEQRWTRAITRLHKELLGQDVALQRVHVRMLQEGIPPLINAESGPWVAQLQALFVALGADAGGRVTTVEGADLDWLQSWVNELSAFIPGFLSEPSPVPLDSQSTAAGEGNMPMMDHDLDKLLEDELSEEHWQDQRRREEDEERRRLAAHEELQEREMAELKADARAYREWEQDQVRQEVLAARPPHKRRCVLAVEAASGSGDHPRILHTLALDVPLTGEPVSLTIRARMEADPENVSTVQVESEPGPPIGPGQKAVNNDTGGVIGAFGELEFKDYEAIYAKWRDGVLTVEEIECQYGREVAEMVQAQHVVAQAEDQSLERLRETGPPPLDDRELSPMMQEGKPKPDFPFFESMYGQWKMGLRTDGNIQAAFGEQWLGLFRTWRVGGLDSIRGQLGQILQTTAENEGDSVAIPRDELPSTEGMALSSRISYSVVKQVHERWLRGLLRDETVNEIYGATWLQMFRRMRDEGVERCRHELSNMVVWDAQELLDICGAGDGHGEASGVENVGTEGEEGKLWLSGEEAEAEAEEAPLHEVLSQADLPGPIGDFPSMKSLVAASRLLVQTKIAGGQTIYKQKGSAEAIARVLAGASGEITDAFALFALSLLGGNALRELNKSCAKNETKALSQVLQSRNRR